MRIQEALAPGCRPEPKSSTAAQSAAAGGIGFMQKNAARREYALGGRGKKSLKITEGAKVHDAPAFGKSGWRDSAQRRSASAPSLRRILIASGLVRSRKICRRRIGSETV